MCMLGATPQALPPSMPLRLRPVRYIAIERACSCCLDAEKSPKAGPGHFRDVVRGDLQVAGAFIQLLGYVSQDMRRDGGLPQSLPAAMHPTCGL